MDCPLKDKCLICGKSGHSFKKCFLVNNNHSTPPSRRIMCIYDEERRENEENFDEIDAIHDVLLDNDEKNSYQLPVTISSVELC